MRKGRKGVKEVLGRGVLQLFDELTWGFLRAIFLPSTMMDCRVGVQIVGRRFREDMILDACEAIEQRVGLMSDKLFAHGDWWS